MPTAFSAPRVLCRTACIGKHREVSLDPLLGQPFGSCYEVNQDGILYPAERDPIGEWHAAKPEDDHRSNKEIFDRKDASAQGLSHDDIARLKKQGVTGDELVQKLCENSATFSDKTAFAQEKYVKKKMLKHLTRVRARQPSARAICEAYFYKQPATTNWMRYDALGLLLLHANLGANAQPLVVESCGGLVVAAAAERVGASGTSGRVCAGHTGPHCNSLDITKLMNLSAAARDCVVTAPLTALLDARVRWKRGEDVAAAAAAEEEAIAAAREEALDAKRAKMEAEGEQTANLQIPKERAEGWRPKRIAQASPSALAHLARPSEGFSSLLVASPALEPVDALRRCLPLCAPSAPFAVWCPFSQPLADALHALRRDRLAVNLALTEPWLRKHQVLPGRTHPTMTTGAGAGGFVLSGVWIPPEDDSADGLGGAAEAETQAGAGGDARAPEDRKRDGDGEPAGDGDSDGDGDGDGAEPKKKAKK